MTADSKSTNPIESLNDGTREVQRNVKRWPSGTMALRWTAAAVLGAALSPHQRMPRPVAP